MAETALQQRIEDHALESVPQDARQNWLTLSWNTAGNGWVAGIGGMCSSK